MKFLLRTIIIAIAAHFALLYFPWWSIAVCGFFAGALLSGSNFSSFFSGFIGVGLLWMVQAFISNNTGGPLSDKIATLFTLPNGVYVVMITTLVGALVAAFGTLSGLRFRRLFVKEKTRRGLYR